MVLVMMNVHVLFTRPVSGVIIRQADLNVAGHSLRLIKEASGS